MTTLKSLPARPSLESLRKQAKKLARHIAGGNAEAIARARTQLPKAELPLSHRDAQLVLRAGIWICRLAATAGRSAQPAGAGSRMGRVQSWQIIQLTTMSEKLKELLAERSRTALVAR